MEELYAKAKKSYRARYKNVKAERAAEEAMIAASLKGVDMDKIINPKPLPRAEPLDDEPIIPCRECRAMFPESMLGGGVCGECGG